MDVINELSSDMQVSDEDKGFIANFYTLAFTGLIIQWMSEGMKDQPQHIIEQLSELIKGDFLKALHTYENKPS
jgi:hypothetical protein